MPGWATTKQLIWESLHTAPPKSYAAARAHHATILKVGRHVDVSELLAVLNTIMGPLKEKADKEAAKADGEASLLELKEENKAKMMENMHTMETLRDIHLDCDWLLQNFDTRKEARAGEVDALKKAKAVLSGADFSLIQTAHIHRHI